MKAVPVDDYRMNPGVPDVVEWAVVNKVAAEEWVELPTEPVVLKLEHCWVMDLRIMQDYYLPIPPYLLFEALSEQLQQ